MDLRYQVLLAIGLLLGTCLRAQDGVGPLALSEAIARGLENNLDVAGQRLNVQVAAENNNWVTAGRTPIVQATLGVNNALNAQDNPASFINGTFYVGNATAGLQASYQLFNGYRVRFTKRQLGEQEVVANQQLRQVIETSVFEVAQAYYDAQLAAARTRVAAYVMGLSSDLVSFQQLRRAYGQGQSIEVLQARSAYLTDSIGLEQARLGEQNALRNLYLAMDADEADFAERPIIDSLVYEERNWDIERIARRIDSSTNVQLLRTQQALAVTNTELARSALKPTLDVTAGLSHTRNAFKLSGEDPRTGDPAELIFGSTGQGSIGLSGAYTLFDGGQRKRNVANAIVAERGAQLQVTNATRDALMQAKSLLATYRNQRELLRLRQALIDNAAANLELAREQQRAGTINSFDYRTLQLNYYRAIDDSMVTTRDLLVTDLTLRRLTGELLR